MMATREQVSEMYADATRRAVALSRKESHAGCVVYVAVEVALVAGVPEIVGFRVVEWHDDACLARVCEGVVERLK